MQSPNMLVADLPDGYAGSIAPLHEALMSCQRLLACDVEDICDKLEAELS